MVTSKFAVFISVALSSNALRSGCASFKRLTAPAVIGPEKDVPDTPVKPLPSPGCAVMIFTPGAVISGLSKPPIDGPRDVKSAIAPVRTSFSS